jgi:hypothetical protein
VSPTCAINHVPDNFPNVRADPGKAVRRSYSAWRLLFWDEPEQAWQQRIYGFADGYHFKYMSTAKHDEAPTANFDTPGRAEKLKAVCLLAGFAIVVLIATAGWLYFLARLVLNLATWIFG